MTTTLRPTTPEDRLPDGGRSRRFTVCVNARPVGKIMVSAYRRSRGFAGELAGLRIDEGERRKGHGTVAVLAAEEVLRGWNCATVEVRVPAGAEAGLRLVAALGYTEVSGAEGDSGDAGVADRRFGKQLI